MKSLKTFTVLFAILIANDIYAQIVSIDRTFGENGAVIIPKDEFIPGGISHLKYDNDGNIVAVGTIIGHLSILKTNPNGVIVESFGINGMVTLSEYFIGGGGAQIHDFKITSENKILLFLRYYAPNLEEIIIRLNENGTIDESFGNNGKVIFDAISYILTINIENNDFMLVADIDNSISKYNYNGEISTNFGDNGKAYLTDNSSFKIFPNNIKILNDGAIFVVGYDNFNAYAKLAFCKLNQNGNFVTDFADNGIRLMDMGMYRKSFRNVIETSNGNLMLTGEMVDNRFICSFDSNGTINQNFGGYGFFYYDLLSTDGNQTFLQNRNKYLIREGLQIVSINSNGTLDIDFNNSGFYIFEDFHITTDMKLQDTDKIIISGVDRYYGNFAIARLNIVSDVSIKEIDYSYNSSIIFPNPANDILHFKIEKQFEIFDIQGKLLLKSEEATNSVNISHLKKGMYFIKFENNKVEKFVKK